MTGCLIFKYFYRGAHSTRTGQEIRGTQTDGQTQQAFGKAQKKECGQRSQTHWFRLVSYNFLLYFQHFLKVHSYFYV